MGSKGRVTNVSQVWRQNEAVLPLQLATCGRLVSQVLLQMECRKWCSGPTWGANEQREKHHKQWEVGKVTSRGSPPAPPRPSLRSAQPRTPLALRSKRVAPPYPAGLPPPRCAHTCADLVAGIPGAGANCVSRTLLPQQPERLLSGRRVPAPSKKQSCDWPGEGRSQIKLGP